MDEGFQDLFSIFAEGKTQNSKLLGVSKLRYETGDVRQETQRNRFLKSSRVNVVGGKSNHWNFNTLKRE